MNEDTIRSYAKLMKELELSGLEITEGSTSIRLERSTGNAVIQGIPAFSEEQKPAESEQSDFEKITSPMVGVFYAAPAENAEPFVKVGDRIKKGDTLCIIEAMKLMNEVQAEHDCTIREICVKNGDTVEYGTVLFLIDD